MMHARRLPRTVRWAALGTWIVTVDGGLLLLGLWLRAGGLRRRRRGPRIGPELVFVHLSLAATALGLWIAYLATGRFVFAVSALGVVVGAATLGFTMFGIWLVHRLVTAEARSLAPEARPVDQRLPVVIIALHGLFAATTIGLVAYVVAGAA